MFDRYTPYCYLSHFLIKYTITVYVYGTFRFNIVQGRKSYNGKWMNSPWLIRWGRLCIHVMGTGPASRIVVGLK